MYCAVNFIENPYIANYIKKRKQIEDEENTNEREETSQYPPIISYDTTKKYTSVMIRVCHSRSRFLSCMYIHDKFMTESR